MRKIIFIIILATFTWSKSNGQNINERKLDCYDEKLKELKQLPVYDTVMQQFLDTVPRMLNNKKLFNVPSEFPYKIDDAIFFKPDKKECLLLILHKSNENIPFGIISFIRGRLMDGQWTFKYILSETHGIDAEEVFPEFSFDNLSTRGRLIVLKNGRAKRKGCEIDELYWFVELKAEVRN